MHYGSNGAYSPIEHLVKALWLNDWRNNYMLMLTGYFDETGQAEDSSQKVNGMAGFIAPADSWLAFENDWNEHVKKKQYKDYHDKDIRRKDRERRRRPLLDILEKYPILPVGYLVSMDAFNSLPQIGKDFYGDPYYRSYVHCMGFTCLFVAQWQTREERLGEKVLTVFDRKKQHFRERLMQYYEVWRCGSPLAERMLEEPVFRYADFPPMYAADMLAAVLKEEFERRMYRPKDSPTESFERVSEIGCRALRGVPGESDMIPFAMLGMLELKRALKPIVKEALRRLEEENGNDKAE